MVEIPEELKREVQDIMDRVRWQEYVSGKIEGALNVLYAMDLDKDKRLPVDSSKAASMHVELQNDETRSLPLR